MSLRSISFNTVSWFNNAFKVSHSLCARLETFTLNTCSAISLPIYTGRRPGQKLFMGWGQGASWVHTDECRICSSSCFHNEVKGNMKYSKVCATPSALWSRTSSCSSGRPLLLCCVCMSFLLGQASSFSKFAWFLIMFGLAFFKCILFQGIASNHFSFCICFKYAE